MTTPSKLSLKKRIRQKLESGSGSRNDVEAEKENVPRGSRDNLSDRSSRRCSTIIAGNLGLVSGAIRGNTRGGISGQGNIMGSIRGGGNTRGDRLGILSESGERRESAGGGGGLITEDESSFYSCPEPESPADKEDRGKVMDLASRAEDTWMTEVTEREHKVVTTPGNQSRLGQCLLVLFSL